MPFVKALPKSDLKDNSCKAVTLEGKRIGVFHINGLYLAIDDLCTHDEASLCDGGMLEHEGKLIVECPWHGAQFDLKTGKALTLPAVKPVKTYAVRVEGDTLEVEI